MAEPPDSTAAPRIKITGLHIAGYRSLRRVDWPEDGLDWRGEVPDTVLVGGANGSGKTTLLELIFEVVRALLALSAGVELVFDEGIFEGRRVDVGFSVGRDAFTLQFHGTPPPRAHVVLGPAILWSSTTALKFVGGPVHGAKGVRRREPRRSGRRYPRRTWGLMY